MSTTQAAALRLTDIDLTNPDTFVPGYPHEAFRLLRAEAPVYWHRERNGRGFWVVTKYDALKPVSLESKTFSSGRGGTLIREFDGEELEANQAIMLNMDAPRHTRFRRLVNVGFSPRMVNRLETHIRDIAGKIVDAVAARGECDFVTDMPS